jgi:hypothetical protein
MGGKVAEREVRDLLGLSQPKEGEPVLGSQTAQPAGMADTVAGWLQEGNASVPAEATTPSAGSPKEFSRRTWW